jgi:hypothetical protein
VEAEAELVAIEADLEETCAELDARLKALGVDLGASNFATMTMLDALMSILFPRPEEQREFKLRHMAVMAQAMESMIKQASGIVVPKGH